MNDKLISVIVPIFNTGLYLEKCIDSIINQTYKSLEIILVNDGSTDQPPKICDSYAQNDSRIIVIHKHNEGLVKARKDGLKKSTGNYIGYVDGDDWIEPDMYEKLMDIAIVEGADITMCGRYEDTGETSRMINHGIRQGLYKGNQLYNYVFPRMIVNEGFFEWGLFPSLWDKLFKRNAIEKYQFSVNENLTMGEDAAAVYPAILNSKRIYVLHECLYHYRQSSLSMVKRKESAEQARGRFKLLYESVYQEFDKDMDIYD